MKQIVKIIARLSFSLGAGLIAGVAMFPIFKGTLGVRKIKKFQDLPTEEVDPDFE